MSTLHTLKIKNGDTVKDLVGNFDFVCLQGASYPSVSKYKDLNRHSWLDEDGDDVFHPSRRYAESTTLEIPVGCEGDRSGFATTVKAKFEALESFLSGRTGALSPNGLSIYMPREQIGFNGCDITEIKDHEYNLYGDYEIFTCTLVFSVANPRDLYNGQ